MRKFAGFMSGIILAEYPVVGKAMSLPTATLQPEILSAYRAYVLG
ncbi:MAG: hypothetical protein PHD65_06710 [Gallionella sp.]|nr:hypothetical protein [Gallionella sp.]